MDCKTAEVAAASDSCFQEVLLRGRRREFTKATRCVFALTLVGCFGCSPFGAYSDSALDRYPHVVDSKTFDKLAEQKAAAVKTASAAAISSTKAAETASPTTKTPATKAAPATTPASKAPAVSSTPAPIGNAAPTPPTAEAMARRAGIPNIAIQELLTELSEKEGASEADLSMFRDFLSEHPGFADQMLALKNEGAGGFDGGQEPNPIPETPGVSRRKLEPGDRVVPAPPIGDSSATRTTPSAASERIEAKYPPALAQTDASAALASSATSSSELPPPAPSAESAAATTSEVVAVGGEQPGSPTNLRGNWREHLEAAIEALEQQRRQNYLVEGVLPLDNTSGKNDDAQARAEVQLRLLYLMAGRSDEAAAPIKHLAKNPQAFWKHQISGLSLYLDEKSSSAADHRAALALRELRDATKALSKESVLDVRNLAFCSHVQSFGSYTEFPDYRFRPDQETLLYAEVENFVVEKKSAGYETTLQASYQIFDPSGRRVAEHTFPVESELCRNQRRDFFVPFRVYMPKRIYPGEYSLQLTVEDVKGKKFGQGLIAFTIE